MNQNVWGPHAWFFLHTISFNYPINPTTEDKLRYKSFFYDLQHILPCKYCRNNYRKKLKENPIRLDSRKDLFEWLVDIHNEVNAQNGKKPLSYNQVKNIYENEFQKQLALTEQDVDGGGTSPTPGISFDLRFSMLLAGGLTAIFIYWLYFVKK